MLRSMHAHAYFLRIINSSYSAESGFRSTDAHMQLNLKLASKRTSRMKDILSLSAFSISNSLLRQAQTSQGCWRAVPQWYQSLPIKIIYDVVLQPLEHCNVKSKYLLGVGGRNVRAIKVDGPATRSLLHLHDALLRQAQQSQRCRRPKAGDRLAVIEVELQLLQARQLQQGLQGSVQAHVMLICMPEAGEVGKLLKHLRNAAVKRLTQLYTF